MPNRQIEIDPFIDEAFVALLTDARSLLALREIICETRVVEIARERAEANRFVAAETVTDRPAAFLDRAAGFDAVAAYGESH